MPAHTSKKKVSQTIRVSLFVNRGLWRRFEIACIMRGDERSKMLEAAMRDYCDHTPGLPADEFIQPT